MHRIVHVFFSRRRLQSVCIVFLLVLALSLGWGSFGIMRHKIIQTKVLQIKIQQGLMRSSLILQQGNSGNDTSGANTSQSGSVVEIRCILREARNAISADSANTAIELVEAADEKLVATFGNNTLMNQDL